MAHDFSEVDSEELMGHAREGGEHAREIDADEMLDMIKMATKSALGTEQENSDDGD